MFLDGLFALSVIAQRQLVSRQRNVGTDAYALSNFVTTGTLEATGAITQFTFKYLIDSTLETPSAYKTNQVVSKELVADRFFFTKVWFNLRNNMAPARMYAFDQAKPVVCTLPLRSRAKLLYTLGLSRERAQDVLISMPKAP
ncbi:unnamed protein product [Rhizoctonia solani]|uniref:Uncharacterized protein n=1 Tax=Rhizoctonia solani TaxID=456999 RepID=A0A8H3DKA5_9AGAM|nr:unnamed protein product [Rhizoctonia solani]